MASKAAADEVVRVLALDDDIAVLRPLERLLATRGFAVTPFTAQDEAVAALRDDPLGFDVFLLDRFLGPGIDGLDVLVEARRIAPDLPVVMLSGDDSGVTASAALRAGAFYYLQKPVGHPEVVSLTLLRASHYGRLQRRARALEKQVQLSDKFELMVGASPPMRDVFATVARPAAGDPPPAGSGESVVDVGGGAGAPPERAGMNGTAPAQVQGGGHEEANWSDDEPFRKARDIALNDFERRYFTRLLRRTEGNLSEAARLAGLDRSNLRRALARLGMRPEDWRSAR